MSLRIRFGFRAFLAFFIFVKGEVVGLLAQQALRLIGQIFAGLDGFLAGEIEAGFAGKCVEAIEPVL